MSLLFANGIYRFSHDAVQIVFFKHILRIISILFLDHITVSIPVYKTLFICSNFIWEKCNPSLVFIGDRKIPTRGSTVQVGKEPLPSFLLGLGFTAFNEYQLLFLFSHIIVQNNYEWSLPSWATCFSIVGFILPSMSNWYHFIVFLHCNKQFQKIKMYRKWLLFFHFWWAKNAANNRSRAWFSKIDSSEFQRDELVKWARIFFM